MNIILFQKLSANPGIIKKLIKGKRKEWRKEEDRRRGFETRLWIIPLSETPIFQGESKQEKAHVASFSSELHIEIPWCCYQYLFLPLLRWSVFILVLVSSQNLGAKALDRNVCHNLVPYVSWILKIYNYPTDVQLTPLLRAAPLEGFLIV
jgi:hypothetical protein